MGTDWIVFEAPRSLLRGAFFCEFEKMLDSPWEIIYSYEHLLGCGGFPVVHDPGRKSKRLSIMAACRANIIGINILSNLLGLALLCLLNRTRRPAFLGHP